jgi:hypothetical protein
LSHLAVVKDFAVLLKILQIIMFHAPDVCIYNVCRIINWEE